jgi:hypothetical protein
MSLAGQVREHRGTRKRGERARRQRHPEILADLDVQHTTFDVARGEKQSGSERRIGVEQRTDLDSACAQRANCRFS